jgi:hypothetical protein
MLTWVRDRCVNTRARPAAVQRTQRRVSACKDQIFEFCRRGGRTSKNPLVRGGHLAVVATLALIDLSIGGM